MSNSSEGFFSAYQSSDGKIHLPPPIPSQTRSNLYPNISLPASCTLEGGAGEEESAAAAGLRMSPKTLEVFLRPNDPRPTVDFKVRAMGIVSDERLSASICFASSHGSATPGVEFWEFLSEKPPKVLLYNIMGPEAIWKELRRRDPKPSMTFPWDGYQHINWRVGVYKASSPEKAIQHLVERTYFSILDFVQENGDKFRGPGTRLGVNGAPFHLFRLQRIDHHRTSNTWEPCMSIGPTLYSRPFKLGF